MNIKCNKCDTIFEIDDIILVNKKLKFKCSVCSNVWIHEKIENISDIKLDKHSKPSYRFLIILNIIIIFFTALAFYFNMDSIDFIENYWKSILKYIGNLIPI